MALAAEGNTFAVTVRSLAAAERFRQALCAKFDYCARLRPATIDASALIACTAMNPTRSKHAEKIEDELRRAGLPRHLVSVLHRAGLRTLKDLAALSMEQLLAIRGIGAMGGCRVREALQASDLAFQPSADARIAAWERHWHQQPAEPEAMGDASPIARLPLERRTLRCCVAQGLTTVSQVRALSRAQMCALFGNRATVDLLGCLRAAGLPAQGEARPGAPRARTRPTTPRRRTVASAIHRHSTYREAGIATAT
ncbi:hypothetical protein [Ramlibacter humi]|uniref:RNA polymerase alpha subunit C-terminal domain-containing protein n=1 Tax=Ramlibacter humi TaxID=2530451 RepID=A0A4Z0BQI8_9BURK|nr:hypothetical protein [Ramlibacter humi]TFZ00259.1 hypothetical protein EZ216_14260 [Ramlibacter humi]